MLLEDIIGPYIQEDIENEFKARLDREKYIGWIKSVAGFANAKGGRLFIGVEDKTSKLIGFAKEELDSERNYFNNIVNEHLYPRPDMKVDFIPYQINNKTRYIICITIPESRRKPIVVKINGIPSIFIRREGFTNGATYEEIIDMAKNSSSSEYDMIVSDEEYRKEDFSRLFSFYKEQTTKTLTEKKLISIGFFDEEKMLRNGSLLFSDKHKNQGKATLQCAVYNGISRGDNIIVSIHKSDDNILDGIKYAYEFVLQRMNITLIKNATGRKTEDAFPRRALLEGIVNAFAHRDYYIDGSQIQIDMFKDRLEISSPGNFYQGDSLSKVYDLSGVISRRRNELITNILSMCNLMEAAGTGFDKIVDDYKKANEAHKPFITSTSSSFTLVLPDLSYEEGILDDSIIVNPISIPNKGKHDLDILSFCYIAPRTSREIASYLKISDSSYFRQSILARLVNNNLLKESTDGRAKAYRTNRDAVSRR